MGRYNVSVLVIAIVLAACSNTPVVTITSIPSPSAVPSAAASPAPSASRTPAASHTPSSTPKVLLIFEGSGSKSSKPFTASGDSVALSYTFDCSGLGSSGKFDATFYDQNGVAADQVHERVRSGKDTMKVYIANTAPPYHVEVNSDCAWAITVTGTP